MRTPKAVLSASCARRCSCSIFLTAAVVLWIVDGSGGGEGEATAEAAAPRIVSAEELAEAAGPTDAPIFWAGERPGTELELSEAGGEAEGEEVRVITRTGPLPAVRRFDADLRTSCRAG